MLARIDMGWEEWKVGVEFDGAQHWTDPAQRTRDIDRLAELEARGWTIVRVSADMLRYRPYDILSRTRNALRASGCPLRSPNVDLLGTTQPISPNKSTFGGKGRPFGGKGRP